MTKASELQDFANSIGSNGFLKTWKANGIVSTLEQVPGILKDSVRLNKYLTNSLEMEGFLPADISAIQRWVEANIVSFTVIERGVRGPGPGKSIHSTQNVHTVDTSITNYEPVDLRTYPSLDSWNKVGEIAKTMTPGVIAEITNPTLEFLKVRHATEIAKLDEGHDMSDAMYEEFFLYFVESGEMPYGTAKARDGDPYQWIFDQLTKDM